MRNLLSILGSSAFGVLVTLVFNWMQNRRTALLNYITDERKKWREKIRTISAQIERCEFQGKDDLRIEQYLVQLQMNINPYGSVYEGNNCYYYKNDAYIWNVINGIKNAPNSQLFDKNKELLLRYISFMLKMDWEQSKKEMKIFSVMKIFFILTAVFCAAIFLYECLILNLGRSIEGIIYFFIDFIIAYFASLLFSLYYELDIPDYKNKDVWSLKKSVFYQTKGKIISYFVLLITTLVIFISSFGFGIAVNELMVRNMTYYTDINGQVYLYPNFNETFFPDFKVKLQKKLGREVIILENKDNEVKIVDQGIDYDNEIFAVLDDTVFVIFIVKLVRDFLIIFSVYLLCEIDVNDWGVESSLMHSKCVIFDDYEKIVQDTFLIIERVAETFIDSNLYKENDELLGLSYEFLRRAKEKLSHQIYMMKSQIENIQQWEVKNQNQRCLNLVEDSIKMLKKFSKTKRRSVKLNILIEIKRDLQEIIDIFSESRNSSGTKRTKKYIGNSVGVEIPVAKAEEKGRSTGS